MMGANELRQRKLEIRRQIEKWERIAQAIPYRREEARSNIEALQDQEELLNDEYRRQKSGF